MKKLQLPDEMLDMISGGLIYIRTSDGKERRVEEFYRMGDTGEVGLGYRGADDHIHIFRTGESGFLNELKYGMKDLAPKRYVYDADPLNDTVIHGS
ncbi:hypothetical protein [Pseudodesulfovibrio sp.]|uniref:hypothetical protein n=1 Tax=Pseudodesulfovibrio sp. TaxID=2035812 RepID=UPI00261B0DE5|nr:hypothetical protein [Pseudodesulfovibrio sp.]MDD3313758.1 hypothetical protein [Pseudodesulfovibrio sp.]